MKISTKKTQIKIKWTQKWRPFKWKIQRQRQKTLKAKKLAKKRKQPTKNRAIYKTTVFKTLISNDF